MTVQESMEDRKQGLNDYLYRVEAIEGGLKYDIACAFTGVRLGEVPDYSTIPGDPELQERIKEAVDANYSFDNELHPFHGVVNEERLGRNFFNNALARSMLFPHHEMVKTAVGEEDFMGQYGAMERESQKQLQSRLMGSAAADVVQASALPDLKQYLKDSYDGIREPIVDSAENKLQFLQPMTLDMVRLLGGQVTSTQIEDALVGRERR